MLDRTYVLINVRVSFNPFSSQGLRVGDIIVEFGSVTTSNFTNLQEIAAVVQHSKEVRPLLWIPICGDNHSAIRV